MINGDSAAPVLLYHGRHACVTGNFSISIHRRVPSTGTIPSTSPLQIRPLRLESIWHESKLDYTWHKDV